jgi:lon-related putative ATP-dependent protease
MSKRQKVGLRGGKRLAWDPSTQGPRVPWRLLRGTCRLSQIPADTTDDIPPLDGRIIGQERALRALELATRVAERDYNVFVSGPARTGKTFLVTSYLGRVAKTLPAPNDWVYVNDFNDLDKPRALSLPAGMGRVFRNDVEFLVKEIQAELSKAFRADGYQLRRDALQSNLDREKAALLRELEKKVEGQGFILHITGEGMSISAARDGRSMTEEEIRALDDEERARLQSVGEALHAELNRVAREMQAMDRAFREREATLRKQVAAETLDPLFERMEEKYRDVPGVQRFFQEMKEDILTRIEELAPWEEEEEEEFSQTGESPWDRYQVNLFVEHAQDGGAPVIMEPNPTYSNLFGKVERRAEMGVLTTDIRLIRPGAIHRANGGFLILQAEDVLQWPLAWEALKRALRFGEVRIEDTGEQMGMVTAKGLSPEPIPLQCRVILIGSPALHQMLYMYDDQFRKIFKVKADLDDEMDRGPEEVKAYCSYLATVCRKWNLLPIDRTGMARLVEYGSELAGHQEKLTLQLSEVEDIVRESHIWAKEEGAKTISAAHVEKAIKEKTKRSNLPEEKIQELIQQGVLVISTRGRAVGVVNGLSVYDLGDHVFARPTRVTGSISLGRDGVLDIEREAKLGGNIHTKGILILTGFLKWRFAQDKPLSLSASLCFEQSYEDVEGDSASCAELCALLSALADLPVDQGIAVTGAVSQHGEVLPVGDVTRKVEGFYRICKLQGLSGSQGVIIPAGNIKDLMLDREVLEAVRKGKFHVFAVEHVDQAMEILTGVKAGELQEDGTFEPGTINDRIDETLRRLNELYREYAPEEPD